MELLVPDSSAVQLVIYAVLSVVFVTATWVYMDAKSFVGRGRPIASSVGPVRVRTPVAWFFACLLLWEVFVPLYVQSRSAG